MVLTCRYAAGIQHEVDALSASLKLLSDTLEAWMDLQRMWVYLEPIFAAPDIQRQLPEESQHFTAIDRSFRSQVLAVRERPNVMQAFSSASLWKACKQKNESLEHILVCMLLPPCFSLLSRLHRYHGCLNYISEMLQS